MIKNLNVNKNLIPISILYNEIAGSLALLQHLNNMKAEYELNVM